MKPAQVSLWCIVGALAATSASGQQPAAPAASVGALEEVVVTARKREESLQAAPLAVSAFGEASLARQQISTVVDLNLAVPSVLVTRTGGSSTAAQIFIRGIGQDSLGFNSETPIAVYLDDVYMGRVQGTIVDFIDLERVEVLRGPQGTLYGRNSTAGAVKYVMRRPDLQHPRFVGDVTVGSYNRADVRASGSMPFADGKFAIKADVAVSNQDGYVEGVDATGKKTGQDANGVDRKGGRVALRWQASDVLDFELAVDMTRDRSGVQLSTPITCVSGANSQCEPLYGDPYLAGINLSGQKSDSSGASLRIEWGLDWANLKSVTAVRKLEFTDPIDLNAVPGAPLTIMSSNDQNQWSQEFQLTSKGSGPWSWVAGAFYFHEESKPDSTFLGARRNVDDQTADSFAVYGEASYGFANGVTLTAGGRWTQDKKDIDRLIYIPMAAATPSISASGSFNESVFTPKVSLSWKATDAALLYATYAEGYKPGGFSETWPSTAVAATGQFKSEKTKAYELGAKTSWMDERLTFNAAVYQTDYNGLQQSLLTTTSFAVVTSDVQIQGLEFELAARPVEPWLIYGNIGFLNDKIKASTIPGDNLSRRLRYAPEQTYKLGTEVRFPVGGMEFFAGASVAHMGATPMDNANTLGIFMPAYEIVDAQLGMVFGGGRWTVTAGGKNVGDTAYWRSGVAGRGRFYAPPSTYALTIKASF
ncbi:MAG: TonB-dependent receptor [Steroidobacteraceae bacterium]